VREATHMGWAEEPLSRMLSQATTFPAWAANAANLAMRAESVFGAGKGVDDFVYFIGGASGIGGGAITGGRLLSGAAGYAGEFGHSFVRSDGTQCPCGGTGCLEAEVTQARLLEAVGLAPAEAGLLGTRLVSSRDPGVRALISEQLDLLAIAVRTAVNLFNPTLVVLGGFLGDLYDAGGREGDALLRDAIRSAREDVRIEGAASASDQLLIGCLPAPQLSRIRAQVAGLLRMRTLLNPGTNGVDIPEFSGFFSGWCGACRGQSRNCGLWKAALSAYVVFYNKRHRSGCHACNRAALLYKEVQDAQEAYCGWGHSGNHGAAARGLCERFDVEFDFSHQGPRRQGKDAHPLGL